MKTSTNVSNVIKAAEEAHFRQAKAEARKVPLSLGQVLEDLESRARSIHWWLQSFSDGPKKRPDYDIAKKRRELAVLVQVRDRWAKPEEQGKQEAKSNEA